MRELYAAAPQSVVSSESHPSPVSAIGRTSIAVLRDYVERHRVAQGWTHQRLASEIAEAHVRMRADALTGIHFEGRDAFAVAHAAEVRVSRWLDDVSKQANTLPLNMLRTVLAVLPPALRLPCLAEILDGLVTVRLVPTKIAGGFDALGALAEVMRESGEAQAALLALCDGATAAELAVARKELVESIHAQQRALEHVEALLTARSAPRANAFTVMPGGAAA